MAGKLIRILPKRSYDFAGVAVGTEQDFIIADRIDISQWTECTLAVRTNGGVFGSPNLVALDLYGCGYTSDDPSLDFRTISPLFMGSDGDSAFAQVGLVTYGGKVSGHYAALVMRVIRGATGPFSITMSADLILRSPDAIA